MERAFALGRFIDREIKQTLRDQKHFNTGETEKGIGFEVNKLLNGYEIVGYATGKVPLYLNTGVPAGSIKYSETGGGGKSKYVQGLIDYFKSKGFNERDAKVKAFLTARKHKTVGNPVNKSTLNHLQITFNRISSQMDIIAAEIADGIITELVFSNSKY